VTTDQLQSGGREKWRVYYTLHYKTNSRIISRIISLELVVGLPA